MREWIGLIAVILETSGALVILLGSALALGRAGLASLRRQAEGSAYQRLRVDLGRAILLGLELLVAGDIVKTVSLDLSLVNVGVLGLVVVIRTFLSFTLELETDGHWPWQRRT